MSVNGVIRMYGASLWVGKEREYEDDGVRLFVDGVSYSVIEKVLKERPEINCVYFGHDFDWNTVRRLIGKVRVVVEVDSLVDLPYDCVGLVEVVYRVPKIVDYVKVIDRDEIVVLDLKKRKVYSVKWNGKKVYDEDEVIL